MIHEHRPRGYVSGDMRDHFEATLLGAATDAGATVARWRERNKKHPALLFSSFTRAHPQIPERKKKKKKKGT